MYIRKSEYLVFVQQAFRVLKGKIFIFGHKRRKTNVHADKYFVKRCQNLNFLYAFSEYLNFNNIFFWNEHTDKLFSNDFSVSLSKSLMSLGISFSSVIEPANVSCHIWWVLFRISRFLCLSEARKNGLRSSSKERSNFPSYLKMNKINCHNSSL